MAGRISKRFWIGQMERITIAEKIRKMFKINALEYNRKRSLKLTRACKDGLKTLNLLSPGSVPFLFHAQGWDNHSAPAAWFPYQHVYEFCFSMSFSSPRACVHKPSYLSISLCSEFLILAYERTGDDDVTGWGEMENFTRTRAMHHLSSKPTHPTLK